MIPNGIEQYCEVFSGAGWVFFRKEKHKFEALNDRDSDLICFYRVLQNHLEEFCKQFKWLLSSREMFLDWNKQVEAGGLTDIQRAARYYYLQRHAFGGKVSDRYFAAAKLSYPPVNLLRLEEELSAAHLRLSGVTVENLDWSVFVDRYDNEKTLFYLDPPYFGAPFYKHNFYEIGDYQKIAEKLRSVKGKFILSINETKEIREVFRGFKIKPVAVKYSINAASQGKRSELIVSNF